jgi:nucleotide-binding universal stress UspA family protein
MAHILFKVVYRISLFKNLPQYIFTEKLTFTSSNNMDKMKTILVPTDFSLASENAAIYAIGLANHYKNTKVLLLHVYSIPLAESSIMPLQFEELEAEHKALLKAFGKRLLKLVRDVEIEYMSCPGFVVDEILRVINEQNAFLVIMGAKTDIPETTSGNNIISVIKQSKIPVLVVPEKAEFKKPEKIAFACDYTKSLPSNVIDWLKDYAKSFQAKILIFDILKKGEIVSYQKALAEVNLENSLNDVDHNISFPSGDNVPEEINAFIKTHKADVLIMVPHNYSFLQGLFHHSNTKEMVFHTPIPLLSIHE